MRLRNVFLVSAILFSACSGNKSTGPSTTTTLLDTTVALQAGALCSSQAQTAQFTGTASKRVTVTATGTGLTFRIVLYQPDFATQITVADSLSPATTTQTLTQSGTHFVVFCERNGVAGSVRLTVTQD